MSSSVLQRKVFRLKRKADKDPLSTLTLSIKRFKKLSPGDPVIIHDVLHLAKSCCQPVDPDLSNVGYHDLSIASSHCCKESDLNKQTDAECKYEIKDDGSQDLFKIDPDLGSEVSSKESVECSETITCNGEVMCRVKGQQSALDKAHTTGSEEFMYDFYVPENYELFKAGLPDRIKCKIDTDNLVDGVISLNAHEEEDFEDPPFYVTGSSSTSISATCDPYYVYRNQRDIDRMYESDGSDYETGGDERKKSYVQGFCSMPGKSQGARAMNYFSTFNPDDEDSNDEDDWRNDYPDEDEADNDEDGDAQNFDSACDCSGAMEQDSILSRVYTTTPDKKRDQEDDFEEDLSPYLEQTGAGLKSQLEDFDIEGLQL